MTTRVITLWRMHVTSLTSSISAMHFLTDVMFIVKAMKYHFKESYDKQNLACLFISYEINETSQRLFSLISYEMIMRVKFSNYYVYLTSF